MLELTIAVRLTNADLRLIMDALSEYRRTRKSAHQADETTRLWNHMWTAAGALDLAEVKAGRIHG